jgi:hypothetical protein
MHIEFTCYFLGLRSLCEARVSSINLNCLERLAPFLVLRERSFYA